MAKMEDLTGMKFGRLTVIEHYGKDRYGHNQWICKCDCGNEKIVRGCDLKRGSVVSCGCYWKERLVECNTIHNFCNDHKKLYGEYYNMIKRCHDEKCKNYTNYGARGIKVCDRWRDDIRNFYDDVSVLPHFEEAGYSLDRIDNDGDYTPDNVRWATIKEQNMNKRNTISFDYKGETRTLKEWSEIFNIPYEILYQRVRNAGGNLEKVIAKEKARHNS